MHGYLRTYQVLKQVFKLCLGLKWGFEMLKNPAINNIGFITAHIGLFSRRSTRRMVCNCVYSTCVTNAMRAHRRCHGRSYCIQPAVQSTGYGQADAWAQGVPAGCCPKPTDYPTMLSVWRDFQDRDYKISTTEIF